MRPKTIQIRLIRRFERKSEDVVIFIEKVRRRLYVIRYRDKWCREEYAIVLHSFTSIMQYVDTVMWQLLSDTDPFAGVQYDVPGFPGVMLNTYDVMNPYVYGILFNTFKFYNRYHLQVQYAGL